METVVQLRADIAAHYVDAGSARPQTGKKEDPAKNALDTELARLGLSLRPIHPGTQDRDLARYFILVGTESSTDTHILKKLNELEAVTAAYTKPGAEPA